METHPLANMNVFTKFHGDLPGTFLLKMMMNNNFYSGFAVSLYPVFSDETTLADHEPTESVRPLRSQYIDKYQPCVLLMLCATTKLPWIRVAA